MQWHQGILSTAWNQNGTGTKILCYAQIKIFIWILGTKLFFLPWKPLHPVLPLPSPLNHLSSPIHAGCRAGMCLRWGKASSHPWKYRESHAFLRCGLYLHQQYYSFWFSPGCIFYFDNSSVIPSLNPVLLLSVSMRRTPTTSISRVCNGMMGCWSSPGTVSPSGHFFLIA